MSESSLKAQAEKLRKACNECNAAKTRCSGEKSGCNRCKASGVQCVYEQSRVGKVPGVRAKKAKPRNVLTSRRDSGPLSSPLEPQHHPAMGAMQAHDGNHYFGDSTLEGWSTHLRHPMEHGNSLASDDMDDIFDGTFELENPPYPRNQMQPTMRPTASLSTASTDLIDPNLDFTFDDVEGQSTVATSTSSEVPRPHATPALPRVLPPLVELRHQTQTSSDSQCILACCSIVTNLETYIDARIKVLDLALDVVRKAVTSLTQIIDQGSNSRCCHMLLAAIMYQVVLVLERGCATFLEQHHAAATGTTSSNDNSGGLAQFDSVGGMLCGFGFSGFQVDAGEQRAWRARVVLKEIRQVNEILKRITALATRDATIPLPALAEETCHRDVILRLETLAAQLEQVQNS
ncbi:hypothetical protein MMC17_003319 [Xylographa soralifera]|nr:hypothetical protein [Xylographa soralifera]